MLKRIVTIYFLHLNFNYVYSSIVPLINTINDTVQKISDNELLFNATDGSTLNCLGIPSNVFANVVDRLFTQETKAEDVRFYLYSQQQSQDAEIHADDDFDIQKINYDFQRPTVVIIHGFLASGKDEWVQNLKDAFLKLDDLNVIIVDWQHGSNTWNYYSAAVSTKIVGAEIAKFFSKIKQKLLSDISGIKSVGSIHFVGHSLGAHISAHASYLIGNGEKNKQVKWLIDRITALDPAQPCFITADPSLKLDKNDASFVDVIHSNGRHILLLGLGLPDQLGDLDFYPNGGQIQLGCNKINATFWNFLLLPSTIISTAICSHGRSHELFTDSINVKLSKECKYVGHKWDHQYENIMELLNDECTEDICPEMGIDAVNYREISGSYFVPTSASEHFCSVTQKDKKAIKKQLLRDKSANNNAIVKLTDQIFG